MNPECEAYRLVIMTHAGQMIDRSKIMSEEQWRWRASVPAPSAEDSMRHAWAWMVSDRMHLEERPDVQTAKFDVPLGKADMIEAFRGERDSWSAWLTAAESKDLDKKVKRYGLFPVPKRFYISHALQNLMYKSGQFSVSFYAQGLDGEESFKATMPDDILGMVQAILSER